MKWEVAEVLIKLYLTQEDFKDLDSLDVLFKETMKSFDPVDEDKIVAGYGKMGKKMQEICAKHPNIKVFSFETEEGAHAEASHVISKLRDVNTNHQEFMYYSQRAYEMLFRMAYTDKHSDKKSHIFVKTPVNFPVQNYAVHKIPDIEDKINKRADRLIKILKDLIYE